MLGPDPAELVDAKPAELRLFSLKAVGVGYRQVAKLTRLSPQVILEIRDGRRAQIRADIACRIMACQAILAHGQTVTGWRTWRLIDSLERDGFTRGDIAQRLGASTPQLQIERRRIRVRTALKVRTLHQRINAEALDEPETEADRRAAFDASVHREARQRGRARGSWQDIDPS